MRSRARAAPVARAPTPALNISPAPDPGGPTTYSAFPVAVSVIYTAQSTATLQRRTHCSHLLPKPPTPPNLLAQLRPPSASAFSPAAPHIPPGPPAHGAGDGRGTAEEPYAYMFSSMHMTKPRSISVKICTSRAELGSASTAHPQPTVDSLTLTSTMPHSPCLTALPPPTQVVAASSARDVGRPCSRCRYRPVRCAAYPRHPRHASPTPSPRAMSIYPYPWPARAMSTSMSNFRQRKRYSERETLWSEHTLVRVRAGPCHSPHTRPPRHSLSPT